MSIRMRRPETTRLDLSGDDYLVVKKYLTAGEAQQLFGASVKPVYVPQGTVTPEILAAAMSQMQVDITAATRETILAYLLDWSFQDPDGRPLVIADQPRSVVSAILSNIDDDAYMEVLRAIGAHKAAVDAEVAAQKKIPRGPRPLTPISTSVG